MMTSIPDARQLSQLRHIIDRRFCHPIKNKTRRKPLATNTAYGLTLTPWVTQEYFSRAREDEKALMLIAGGVAGIALVALAGYFLAPIVAGMELGALIELAVGAEELGGATALARAISGLSGTVETVAQWISALGRSIIAASTLSPGAP